MEELIVRIYNLLPGNSGASSATDNENIVLGAYTFNTHRQVLIRENEEKKLSYRENELLRFIYEKRNNIIDRRDILNTLWGNDSFFSTISRNTFPKSIAI